MTYTYMYTHTCIHVYIHMGEYWRIIENTGEYWKILKDMACYTGPPLAPKLDGVGLIDNRPFTDYLKCFVRIKKMTKRKEKKKINK